MVCSRVAIAERDRGAESPRTRMRTQGVSNTARSARCKITSFARKRFAQRLECLHIVKRIATIIIRNKNGDFFVHQRRKEKKTFPSLFGLGAGGHIEENETPEEGAARELFEETGINKNPTFLFNFDYESDVDSYPVYVFIVETEKEPNFEEREWQWSGWVNKEAVDDLLQADKLCPDTAIFYKIFCENFLDSTQP